MNFARCIIAISLLLSSATGLQAATWTRQQIEERCAPQRQASNDGTANHFFVEMLDDYGKGDLDGARVGAGVVTGHYAQYMTAAQLECANNILELIRDRQKETVNHPQDDLKTMYLDYIVLQACFDSRKEFRVQYITQQEMEAVRTVAKRDELALLRANPALAKQKDQVWNLAKSQYGESVFARGLGASGTTFNKNIAEQCKTSAMRYTGDKKYQQEQIRKDF